jgi:hypothetical protein
MRLSCRQQPCGNRLQARFRPSSRHHSTLGGSWSLPSAQKRRYIPEPTWSIASLELDRPHTPVSRSELERLAKRAVIDLSLLDSKNNQLGIPQLCQDVGNMMHMMNQVQEFVETMASKDTMSAETLYDAPRGITSPTAPTAVENATSDNDWPDRDVSLTVRQSYWGPRLKRVGGHEYFEIVTARQVHNEEDLTVKK